MRVSRAEYRALLQRLGTLSIDRQLRPCPPFYQAAHQPGPRLLRQEADGSLFGKIFISINKGSREPEVSIDINKHLQFVDTNEGVNPGSWPIGLDCRGLNNTR